VGEVNFFIIYSVTVSEDGNNRLQ